MLAKSQIMHKVTQDLVLAERNLFQQINTYNTALLPMNSGSTQTGNVNVAAGEIDKLFKSVGIKYDPQEKIGLLAAYAMFYSNIIMGYEVDTGRIMLYTSSITLLTQMAKQGILLDNKDGINVKLESWGNKLNDVKGIKRNIDRNSVLCVKLEFYFTNGHLRCKGVIPKVAPTFDKYVFTPFACYKEAWQLLERVAENSVVQITMGDKVRYCTKNLDLLTQVWGESRAYQMIRYISEPYTQSLYLPVLNAPVSSMGATRIALEKIDTIQTVVPNQVDMGNAAIDVSRFPRFVYEKLGGDANAMEYIRGKFGIEVPEDRVDTPEKRAVYILSHIKPHELYNWISTETDVSGYNGVAPNYTYTDVTDQIGSVQMLMDLFDKNLVQVIIRKKEGSFSRFIATNNKTILKSIYGDDYVGKYESDGVVCRNVLQLLKKTETGVTSDYSLNMIQSVAGKFFTPDLNALYDKAEKVVEEKNEKITSKGIDSVTVRAIDAIAPEDKGGYYKTVSLSAIESLEVIQ